MKYRPPLTVIGIPSTPRSSSPLAVSTSGSREPAREVRKGTALWLTLRAPACHPPSPASAASRHPVSRCARGVLLGRWQPGRHGVLSQGARARSAALCRACSECSSMAVGKHGHMPERSDVHARRGAAAVGEIGGAMTFDWRRAAGRPWTVAACWCQVVWQEGRRRPGPLPAVSVM